MVWWILIAAIAYVMIVFVRFFVAKDGNHKDWAYWLFVLLPIVSEILLFVLLALSQLIEKIKK